MENYSLDRRVTAVQTLEGTSYSATSHRTLATEATEEGRRPRQSAPNSSATR